MTEADLVRKLAAIERLLHGATTDGERTAAQHVLEALKKKGQQEKPEEMQFTIPDVWARKLFIAMVRKAGLEPYRLRGQRRTTVMVTGARSLLVDTLWKEFGEAQRVLAEYLEEVTDRVIQETLGESKDDVRERPALGPGTR